jgi:hypothetical protein
MEDSTRSIAIQGNVANTSGIACSPRMVGVWNVAISAAAVATLWSTGMGTSADLRADFEQYTSKDALVHWYVPGREMYMSDINRTIGKDYASGPSARPVGAATRTSVLIADFLSADSDDLRPQNGSHCALNTSEYYRTTTDGQPLGISNTITIMATVRPIAMTGTYVICDFGSAGTNANRILLQIAAAVSNDPLNLQIYNSSATIIKNMSWPFAVSPTINTVQRSPVTFVMTWDGPNNVVKMYMNGLDMGVASTIATDVNSSARTDANTGVWIGADKVASNGMNGNMTDVACWNVILPPDEIAFLYNEGYPLIDLNKNQLGYYSASNLKHWWRLGQPASSAYPAGTAIGVDQVKAGAIDVSTSAVGITSDADILQLDNTYSPGHSLSFATWGGLEAGAQLLNVANAWSIFIYGVAGTTSNTQTIFQAGEPDTANAIIIEYVDAATDYVRMRLYNSAGALFKDYRYNTSWINVTPTSTMFTWDGTTLLAYRFGALDAQDTTTLNDAGTMTDTARAIYVGRNHLNSNHFNATTYLGQIVMWDVCLASPEANVPDVAYLQCDPRQNGGTYQSGANVKHLWRFGSHPYYPARDMVGGMHLTGQSGVFDYQNHAFRKILPSAI